MVLNCAGETRKRDVTTMFTYSHANTSLGQSERAYYLSYFINKFNLVRRIFEPQIKISENLYQYFTPAICEEHADKLNLGAISNTLNEKLVGQTSPAPLFVGYFVVFIE